MKLLESFSSAKKWQWRISRRINPWMRVNWPVRSPRNAADRPRIAIVTVNYNTASLVARLVFSLRRFVDASVILGPIVVVDNKSTDGSVPLLRHLADAGLVDVIFNQTQMYHGPGLNQGVDFLLKNALAGKQGYADIDYVFVVDSDVFICRGELFSDAIKAMNSVYSAMAGEFEANEYIEGGYAHVSSLLFDPAVCWRRGFHPFEEHGVPALQFQRTLIKRREPRLDFPFRSHFYLIHLWSGTLKSICSANEKSNKYFDWASADLPTRASLDEKTKFVLEEFEQCFRTAVPVFESAIIAAACGDPAHLRLTRPYEIAPKSVFAPKRSDLHAGFVVR
jgi:glycosyltransferase involved in cell wall biosynthesis